MLATFLKYLLRTLIITSVLSGLILFWLTLIPIPDGAPLMLSKLWNCGVRIRDKRGDGDRVSSAYWSQGENAFTFLLVISCELGTGGWLTSRSSSGVEPGLCLCAIPLETAWGVSLYRSRAWSGDAINTEFNATRAPNSSLLVIWVPRSMSLNPDPFISPQIWPPGPCK